MATRLTFGVFSVLAAEWADHHATEGRDLIGVTGFGPVEQWVQWDAVWYQFLAAHLDQLVKSSFFPLYPLLIASVTSLVGPHQRPLAAVIVANGAMLVGLVALALLGLSIWRRNDAAFGGVRAAIAYPLSFMTFAPMSEALFFALVCVALLAARRRIWWVAAVAGLLAALTRPTGIILGPVLFVDYLSQAGWFRAFADRRAPSRLSLRPIVAALCVGLVPVAGLGGFMLAEWRATGDPLLFAHIQQTLWHHQLMAPWQSAALLIDNFRHGVQPGLILLDGLAILGFGGVMVVAVKQLPAALTLFMALLLITTVLTPVPTNPDLFVSAARYLGAGIPVFLVVGRYMARYPTLDLCLVASGFLLQGVFAFRFVQGFWVS